MLRLVCLLLLWLGCGLPGPVWAQDEACSIRILSTQAAKAAATGAPPVVAELDWIDVTLPDQWQQRWPDHDGAVWYRIDWQNPCPQHPVALALNTMVMAGEVFVNSEAIWRDKSLQQPLSRSWNMPRYWLLPPSLLDAGSNSIWVRVHGVVAQTPGLGSVRIGDPRALREWFDSAWWNQRTLFVMSATVSLVLCVLFSFAWLQNRAEAAFGWYALNTLCWVCVLGSVLATETWPFPSTLAMSRATSLVFIVFVYSFCLFSWRFGGLRLPRLERALGLLSLLAAAMALLPASWLDALHALWLISVVFTLVACGNCFLFPLHAWRTRKLPHLVYAGCLLAFVAVGIHDALLLHSVIRERVPLLPYTAPLTMLALAFVLGRQITLNVRRIERFNQELTQTVAQACDDLSHTLEREHHLALSHSRLQERMQISQDLHDSLGGSLVRSIALVEQAEQPLQNAQVLSMLKLMRDDLRQMIDSGTSAALNVPETPLQWIAPLRHRFAGLFEALDIRAEWRLPPSWSPAPSPIQCLTLTRVLEEALTNVIKHSRAQSVTVEMLQPDTRELCLRIRDDGLGFDVPTIQSHGMGVGMRSMLARLERVHGTLQIQSRAGHTVLTALLSLGDAAHAVRSEQPTA